MNGIEVIYNGC